ncbi:MAG: flagellar export chaperone FliS [Acidobacteriota bacterium]
MMQAALQDRARRAYQTTQVQPDDPIALVVQLYDGMLGFLRRGADHLACKEFVPAADRIRRAADILGELQAVLDMERGGEVAFNLDRLYAYSRRRLMEGHLQADPAALREIADLLQPLRDAWAEARLKQMSCETESPVGAR